MVGSWSDWLALDEMSADPRVLGRHTLQVQVPGFSAEFQIVRNRDWSQVLFPSYPRCGSNKVAESKVLGPDDGGHGYNWVISCQPGDHIVIEFHRTFEDGKDRREVSWRIANPPAPAKAVLDAAAE